MPNRDVYSSKPAALRDFGGGWNVTDNEYNTASRFQTVSDNVVVGTDNAIGPRFGYKLFADLKRGTVTRKTGNVTYQTFNASPVLRINKNAHGHAAGDHVTVSSLGGAIANIPDQPSGVYGIRTVDVNWFEIVLRANATANATSGSLNFQYDHDNHVLGGSILEAAYFQGYLLIFSDIGEIASISSTAITRIWDVSKSNALAGNPIGWRKQTDEVTLSHVSFDTFKQSLLVVNGKNNDKPIDINLMRTPIVEYLVDPATSSNSFVYSAEFILSFDGYVLLVNSNNTSTTSTNTDTTVDISARGTSGVFVGNPSPDDAVQIDLGRITQTIEPRITGVSTIRNKVFIGFYDSAMLGTLGTYNGTVHEPQFDDQVPQHGTINHRVISNLGNDLLMCDYAGVPAFSQSQIASTITPQRISQLIDPELNKHLSRLSPNTLRYNAFSVFAPRDHQYMLFIPKFDSASVFLGADVPFYIPADLAVNNQILVNVPNHTVSVGDFVTISGASSFTGLNAGQVNGTREVVGIVNADYIIIQLDVTPTATGTSGGGYPVTFTPVSDETLGYIFTVNPALRIRRWTRFRHLNWICGTVSREGRVFFCTADRVYQFGGSDNPYYGDGVNDYDYASYTQAFTYAEGDTVYDSTTLTTYRCLESYISVEATFAAERVTNDTYWEVYLGEEIEWAAETPWSDFGDRQSVKSNKAIRIDATGSAGFTMETFVDSIYWDLSDYTRAPSTSMDFVGKDAGGYGAGTQNYGTGRRTKEQFGYTYPFRCMIAKVRISGSTKLPLRISGIFFLYQKGSSIR